MDAKERGFVSQNWEILGGIGNMNTILIGIAGGTGSGKTTLTRHLKEHFGKDVTVIGHDSYYKRQVGRTYEERAKVNYDHPNAFDTDLLIRHLQELKAGRSIQCPVYSFVEHNRTDQTVEIQPAKVIIVEGILIFQNPTLRDMFDIKIFVETDADEIACESVLVATGGVSYPLTGSTGDGLRFARELGHTVTPPRPSLVPLESDDPW